MIAIERNTDPITNAQHILYIMRTTLAHENEERSKFEGNQVKRRIDFKTQWNEIVLLSRARSLFCRFIITQFNLSWDTAIHSDLYHCRADWLTDYESLCVCSFVHVLSSPFVSSSSLFFSNFIWIKRIFFSLVFALDSYDIHKWYCTSK